MQAGQGFLLSVVAVTVLALFATAAFAAGVPDARSRDASAKDTGRKTEAAPEGTAGAERPATTTQYGGRGKSAVTTTAAY